MKPYITWGNFIFKVAEDFIDMTTPLKQLSDAAMAPLGKLKKF